ncbi:MAG: peptidoglycan editing factor PgeF [Candidatus Sumerlaeia bacterium]
MSEQKVIYPEIFAPFQDVMLVGMSCRSFMPDLSEDRLDTMRRLPDFLGISKVPAIVGEQVHGTDVALVEETAYCSGLTEIPNVDALVCNRASVLLGVYTADCVPVVLGDPVNRVIAVVHAGRKGVAGHIVLRALDRMTENGAEISNIHAWVAPSICADHYEVSREMAIEFERAFGHYEGAVVGPESRYLDLGLINYYELIEAGIPKSQILLDRRCTYEASDLFFSYRRDGSGTGRMITFACMRG